MLDERALLLRSPAHRRQLLLARRTAQDIGRLRDLVVVRRNAPRAVRLANAPIAQDQHLAPVHDAPLLDVREGEGLGAVTAVSGAEDREQRLVLRDRLQLTITEGI